MDKKKAVLDALEELFSDTGVELEKTKEQLEEIRDEIDMKIAALNSDIARR